MAHNNAVLRHIVAKIVFPGGSNRQERRSWKETPLLATERLWSNLTGIQTFHSRLTSSQHIPTVRETPDSLLTSWFQSCIAYSLLHTPWLLSFLGRHYSRVLRHFRKATWLDCQHSGGGNKNGIGRSPDQFFPCGEKWSGNETTPTRGVCQPQQTKIAYSCAK